METAGARVSCAMGLALLAFGCGYTRSRFRRLDVGVDGWVGCV